LLSGQTKVSNGNSRDFPERIGRQDGSYYYRISRTLPHKYAPTEASDQALPPMSEGYCHPKNMNSALWPIQLFSYSVKRGALEFLYTKMFIID
jgi:hypothetical protein